MVGEEVVAVRGVSEINVNERITQYTNTLNRVEENDVATSI